MARLIIIFIIAFIVYAALRMLLAKQNLTVKQFFAIYFATLLGLALLFLGVTGRLHPLFAVLGAVLPFLSRLLPWISRGAQLAAMYKMFRNLGLGGAIPGTGSANAPHSSEIKSRFIHMVLFHDTGMMDGTVLEGQFKDAKLSQLELNQLTDLLREIQGDADSSSLLMAYLDREHEGWQTGQSNQYSPPPSDNDMTESQALDILGLEDDATPEDIVDAHRRMMQKMHPDRGGSTYLAAKINAAKELLVKLRGKA